MSKTDFAAQYQAILVERDTQVAKAERLEDAIRDMLDFASSFAAHMKYEDRLSKIESIGQEALRKEMELEDPDFDPVINALKILGDLDPKEDWQFSQRVTAVALARGALQIAESRRVAEVTPALGP